MRFLDELTLGAIINDDQNVMTTQQNISYFKTFYSDFFVTTFSLLLLMVVGTIGSIVLTGSREEGIQLIQLLLG